MQQKIAEGLATDKTSVKNENLRQWCDFKLSDLYKCTLLLIILLISQMSKKKGTKKQEGAEMAEFTPGPN